MPGAGGVRAGVTLRELRPGDAAGVHAIAAPEIERSGYSESLAAALDAGLSDANVESRGLVALQRDQLVGVIVFGVIAGSLGVGRIQFIVVAPDRRRRRIGSALMDGALENLVTTGMRTAFVELPDDPVLKAVKHLLIRCGFHGDGSVPDYFRDGIDLAILRRDLLEAGGSR